MHKVASVHSADDAADLPSDVKRVQLHWIDAAVVAALNGLPTMQKLCISSFDTVDDDSLTALGGLEQPADIDLHVAPRVTNAGLQALLASDCVRGIGLFDNQDQLDAQALAGIGAYRPLRWVGFENSCHVTSEVLGAFRGHPNLRSVGLEIWETGRDGLSFLREVPNLRSFQMGWGPEDIDCTPLHALPKLERLSLYGTGRQTPESQRRHVVEGIARMTTLERLTVAGYPTPPESLKDFGALSRLRIARLNSSPAMAGVAIEALGQCCALEIAILSRTPIRDDDLWHLTRLPALHTLGLSDCLRLTTAAVEPLMATRPWGYINLHKCSNIPMDAARRLGEALPTCLVTYPDLTGNLEGAALERWKARAPAWPRRGAYA